jgi:hypothetical protein
MDKQINEKIHTYIGNFKDSIMNKIRELDFHEKIKMNEILETVNEYEKLTINKDDLSNKKRVKIAISPIHRCNANRANGEQCTRKKKDGFDFCGTHTKGIPNGSVQIDRNIQNVRKVEVVVQDIHGIAYYIDQNNNIYRTEDILSNKENPQIIAKYMKKEDDTFYIQNYLV